MWNHANPFNRFISPTANTPQCTDDKLSLIIAGGLTGAVTGSRFGAIGTISGLIVGAMSANKLADATMQSCKMPNHKPQVGNVNIPAKSGNNRALKGILD